MWRLCGIFCGPDGGGDGGNKPLGKILFELYILVTKGLMVIGYLLPKVSNLLSLNINAGASASQRKVHKTITATSD